MSGYLEPGCLSPDWVEVGLDLGEVGNPVPSWSDPATFSLSVWLMVMGLERPELTFPGSLLFVLVGVPTTPPLPPAGFPLTFESVLLELERCPLRPTMLLPPLDDFAGLGSERYWSGTFEPPQPNKTVSSWCWASSRLVFRPLPSPVPFPMPADLGTLPRVAEPLARVAPLAVMKEPAEPGIFLKLKELVVGGRPMPEGGFFPSSPLLLPASDGERWILGLLDGALPFSDALTSSVLPVSTKMFVMALWPVFGHFLQILSQPNQSTPI